jgi:hypothetical protein
MGHFRVKIPGDGAQTKTARLHRAVAHEWWRAMEAKERANKPKKKPAARPTFAHIRDYREVLR